jgi:hypothetical protein
MLGLFLEPELFYVKLARKLIHLYPVNGTNQKFIFREGLQAGDLSSEIIDHSFIPKTYMH